MVFNVADLFEHAVDIAPDRTAIVCGNRRVTFAELDARSNQLAHHLADRGIGHGDHVGVYASNSLELAESMIALYKLRAVSVNVNFRYTEGELEYVLDNADVVGLVHQRGLSARVAAVLPRLPKLRHVVVVEDGTEDDGKAARYGAVEFEAALAQGSPERDFPERSPDDLYLLYTGGTTGRPKGVVWRHEDVWRALGGGIDFVSGEPLPDEWTQARTGNEMPLVRMCAAPLMHGQAQWAMFGALFGANTVVLMPRFDAHEVWRQVDAEKVNVMAIVGDAMARPMIEAYREGGYDGSSLVALSSTAALLSPGVKAAYLETFPNVFLTDAIGSSETGFMGIGVVSADAVETRGPKVTGSRSTIIIDDDGRRIEGPGRIGRLARGGHVPVGYYKDPEKTARLFAEVDGQRFTVPGDLAVYEEDGSITLLGRGDQCINTGGEKVFPEEVEGILKTHPGVFDALVIGLPDDRLGQRVGALLQWREGAERDAADLERFARGHLAGYKLPRSLWYVEQIERTVAGKPDYTAARAHAGAHPPTVESAVTAGSFRSPTADAR